jgi:Family of unknown function (DUF5335)
LQTQQRKRDVVAGGIDERQGKLSATGGSSVAESGRTILGPIRLNNREQPVPIRRLKKAEWRSYLDRIARALIGRRAAIEIRSPQFSNDIQAEWLPLQGISYDPRKDILEIAVSGLKHMIRKPLHLIVEEDSGQLATLEIIDQDGLSQIVRLREEAARPASVTAVPV